ncbi:sensor histidine kinase [Flavobacterium sp. ARAG 55.4]|uniref:sensor histidine kinase n=1 Tax=Flavobacterium sp. ARAG 55.4 TaxID=3451357 RepID=UPI003F47D2D1
MQKLSSFIRKHYSEIIFQFTTSIVLFLFFSFQQEGTEHVSLLALAEPYKLAFYSNYLIAAQLINYVFLPHLFYKNKNFQFLVSITILITIVILIDEYILEKIYFPETRGTYFPGVLFTLIETLPIIIVMISFKFAWDFNKKQTEIEKLKSLVKENELQFLKSQINPHFLFNNLNNLYSYAIENSPKTPSIILELSSVLRYMLYDCKENIVLLSKEIEQLKNYTTLNELRIEHHGNVQFTENITNFNFKIAPLILMVFIENAFKHCTNTQSENIVIAIHLSIKEDGLLTFICKNSFFPIETTYNPAKGIGLENVKKRLALLYPKTHKLFISSIDNMYEVKLTMQLKPI